MPPLSPSAPAAPRFRRWRRRAGAGLVAGLLTLAPAAPRPAAAEEAATQPPASEDATPQPATAGETAPKPAAAEEAAPQPPATEDATPQPATPFGVWFTQDYDGAIELYPCGESQLCGRLIWMADETPPPGSEGVPLDLNNPEPAKRGHPLCGLEMMRGFRQTKADLWSDGVIYNPDDGHDYHAEIHVQGPVALGMRGFILTPLLGQTEIWTRAPDDFTLRCREK